MLATSEPWKRACAQAVVVNVARSCEQADFLTTQNAHALLWYWTDSLLTFCRVFYLLTVTVQSVDAILLFLGEPGDITSDDEVQKRGIQCYATAYPVLFRHA